MFEKVYGRIADQMNEKGGLAKRLFELTVSVGWKRFLHQQGRAGWWPAACWRHCRRLVAGKVTAKLGGNIRAAVSGGAALNEEIARVFIGLVVIVQGYGLTETAPIVGANPLEQCLFGRDTDPQVQVRIGDNELLVEEAWRDAQYWNNHAATAQILSPGNGCIPAARRASTTTIASTSPVASRTSWYSTVRRSRRATWNRRSRSITCSSR